MTALHIDSQRADLNCLLSTCRCLDAVPPSAIDYFRQSARELIEEKGAVDALAAALAHISGASSIQQRSLLNSTAVNNIITALTRTDKRTAGVLCKNLLFGAFQYYFLELLAHSSLFLVL